jgi:hypothetical protein
VTLPGSSCLSRMPWGPPWAAPLASVWQGAKHISGTVSRLSSLQTRLQFGLLSQPISQTTWLKVTPHCNHCNHWTSLGSTACICVGRCKTYQRHSLTTFIPTDPTAVWTSLGSTARICVARSKAYQRHSLTTFLPIDPTAVWTSLGSTARICVARYETSQQHNSASLPVFACLLSVLWAYG